MSDRDAFRGARDAVPIWLLDVDGVLNAFDESRKADAGWDDWNGFTASGFPIRYSPQMITRITDLHRSGAVEVRWLTTWGSIANGALRRGLNMPELAVAAEPPFRERDGWWKLPVAQDLFNQGHTIIWTDDDITASTDAMHWLDDVANSDRAGDLHAFAPLGVISQQEMADIEAWVAGRVEAAA